MKINSGNTNFYPQNESKQVRPYAGKSYASVQVQQNPSKHVSKAENNHQPRFKVKGPYAEPQYQQQRAQLIYDNNSHTGKKPPKHGGLDVYA